MVTNNNPFDTIHPTLTATNSFSVVVNEVNVAPTLGVISPQTVNELATLTVTNAAAESNIHSATIGYTLVNPPAGAGINGSGVITWKPSPSQSHSTNVLTTVVSNSNPYDAVNPTLLATNSFTVVVKEINQAPVLPSQNDTNINELATLVVTNTALEPNIDSSTVGYGLINPPVGATIDSNGVITWTPVQTQSPGTNLIVTVGTNHNPVDAINPRRTATNSFTVVVNEVNVAPTLGVAGAKQHERQRTHDPGGDEHRRGSEHSFRHARLRPGQSARRCHDRAAAASSPGHQRRTRAPAPM